MENGKHRSRVLVVEDEELLRSQYARYFEPTYRLTFASTGAEALRFLSDESFDLLVLDMQLPDTDGVALLREIRSAHANLPAIITTAYTSIEPQLRLLGVAYSDYIVKPFRLEELGSRIDAIL